MSTPKFKWKITFDNLSCKNSSCNAFSILIWKKIMPPCMTAKYCHVFCEYTWQIVNVRGIYLIFCNSWVSKWSVQYKRKNKADKKCYSIHLLVQNQQPETLQKRFEICSNLSIKTPKRRHSDIFIVNFENIPDLFLGFLLLTLNK